MTEPTREENMQERAGASWDPEAGRITRGVCDMALRTHDAEADRDNYRAKFLREREATDEWATRAQRAEAECERLRKALHRVLHDDDEWPEHIASEALATPPPEGEPELAKHQPCGCVVCTCDDEDRCYGCGAKHCGTHPVGQFPDPVYADAPHTPEQADSYPLDSEGRCLKCGGTGRIGVDSTREPCSACTSTAPEQAESELEKRNESIRARYGLAPPVCSEGPKQAHGDALAALGNRLVEAAIEVHDSVNPTASGVPERVAALLDEWEQRADSLDTLPSSRHGAMARTLRECAAELRAIAAAPTDGGE